MSRPEATPSIQTRIEGAFCRPDKLLRSAKSPSGSAGRCAWHLPLPVAPCSRRLTSPQRECLRDRLVRPPEFHAAAHPRSGGNGERARLQVAVQYAAFENLDSCGALDVAFHFATDRDGAGANASSQLRAGFDHEITLDVDVPLELASETHVPRSVNFAFARDVGSDERLSHLSAYDAPAGRNGRDFGGAELRLLLQHGFGCHRGSVLLGGSGFLPEGHL